MSDGKIEATERIDEVDLVPADDGLEVYTGSGHVQGPWDDDEQAELERLGK